jgi:transposase
MRKRYTYGTVMVDIETGRIVDMLGSRESAEVTEWLKAYPNIRVVSRDGSAAYASAISKAHPGAIQVSDRFHLVKGLTDAARQYIKGLIASRIRIESDTEKESGGYWEKQGRSETDLPERLHQAATTRKAAAVQRVRALAAQGLAVGKIVEETGHSYKTVNKYLDEGFNWEDNGYGVDHPSKLKPYAEVIDEMLTQQRKFREIEEAIRVLGYEGSASTIRMYATRKRKHSQAAHGEAVANTEVVERKWLLKLLYRPIDKIKEIAESQLEKVIRDYPSLATLYDIVKGFKELMFAKRVEDLDAWVESAKSLGSEDVNGFLNGIARDMDAVKNAIIHDYNNGLAEGSVNKIKLNKRIMYGRCGFEMLRSKTLKGEAEKGNN